MKPKLELNNEILARALTALQVEDVRTAILVHEVVVSGVSIEEVCKRYQVSKSTAYKRIRWGKDFLIDYIEREGRAQRVDDKFPKV